MNNNQYFHIGLDICNLRFPIAYLSEDFSNFTPIHLSEEVEKSFNCSLSRYQEKTINYYSLSQYIWEILLSIEKKTKSFKLEKIAILNLVISIPENWDIDKKSLYEYLNQICFDKIKYKFKTLQILNQAIAAATYWLQKAQPKSHELNKNLLIFDMRSSNFSICLCHIDDNKKVKLIHSKILDKSGDSFEKNCVLEAYKKKHAIEVVNPKDPKLARLLDIFGQEVRSNITKKNHRIELFYTNPSALKDYNLYCFGGGYTVKCQQINNAFNLIEENIKPSIENFRLWMQKNQSFDHLLLLGEYSKFSPIKQIILSALKISPEDSFIYDSSEEITIYEAIAYGSCLIANGNIDPLDRFPYTLGVVLESLDAFSEIKKKFIPIIYRGSVISDLDEIQFTANITISSFDKYIEFITIALEDDKKNLKYKTIHFSPHPLELTNYSSDIQWHLGFTLISTEILYLVIQDNSLNQKNTYKLGKVSELFKSSDQ